ncbi:MAG: metal-dependent transcriptional regulator [Gemmatimonadota bacterium]|nr:metal-dependent transcriptional regulator [Gemmatimonadota bacterium]
MTDTAPSLSRSTEDYLKVIYSILERGDTATTSAIASVLSVQPASVTGMVKRLAESGLLEHVPYKGVELTSEGTVEALRVLRRHRIIETYLCERLGFSWDDVHDEAERMEHAVSDVLIERMAVALEHPSHDPHGSPIPTRSGEIETTDHVTLAGLPPGTKATIRAVRDEDPADLRSMRERGLVPGARLRVGERSGASTVVFLTVDDQERREDVDPDIAERIYVTRSRP